MFPYHKQLDPGIKLLVGCKFAQMSQNKAPQSMSGWEERQPWQLTRGHSSAKTYCVFLTWLLPCTALQFLYYNFLHQSSLSSHYHSLSLMLKHPLMLKYPFMFQGSLPLLTLFWCSLPPKLIQFVTTQNHTELSFWPCGNASELYTLRNYLLLQQFFYMRTQVEDIVELCNHWRVPIS